MTIIDGGEVIKYGMYYIKYRMKEKIVDLLREKYIDANIMGVGNAGLFAASKYAATLKKGISFCRTKKKMHGTKKIIDGNYKKEKTIIVIGTFNDLKKTEKYMQKYRQRVVAKIILNEKINKIEIHDCEKTYDIFGDIEKTIKNTKKVINDAVKIMRDRNYMLSSGKFSNIYYETLRAACTFRICYLVSKRNKASIASADLLVGIGYGGVYFAEVASKLFGIPMCAAYHYKNKKKYICEDKNVLFLDDFVTTGRSYKNVKKNILCSSSKLLSIYAKKCTANNLSEITIDTFLE